MTDCLYHMKDMSRGLSGLEIVATEDTLLAVKERSNTYKILNLVVMKKTGLMFDCINSSNCPLVVGKRKEKRHVEPATQESFTAKSTFEANALEAHEANAQDPRELHLSDLDDEELENLEELKRYKAFDSETEDIFAPEVCQPAEQPAEQPVEQGSTGTPTGRGKCNDKSIKRRSHVRKSEDINDEGKYSDEGSEDNKGDMILSDEEDVVGLISSMAPCRKSRAKPPPLRVWFDVKRKDEDQEMSLYMCFTDVYQFRSALKNLHIIQSRDYMYERNDKGSVTVCCPKDHCNFYMCASIIKGESTFCIRGLNPTHTCGITQETSRVNSKWVSENYEETFRSDPAMKVSSLRDKVMRDHGADVLKMMAYRAKWRAADVILGNHEKQYVRIRDYLQTVMDTNPGSRCIVQTVHQPPPATNPRFHRLFYCLGGTKKGFKLGCRPFIGVDGCFVKLSTGAQVLAATGRDGNNNLFPIAFGIVGVEDKPNWCWFLEQLKNAIGAESETHGPWTFMSDRQKGLVPAVARVFPTSEHRFCLRHIYANFQSAGFRGDVLKTCLNNAAYAYCKSDYDVAMSNLKAECEEAWEWINKIPPKHWARHAVDTNCKTDLVVNNLSEVFNNYILDVRDKPVQTMVDQIRTKAMARICGKNEGATKVTWEITPTYAEKLELEKRAARYCRTVMAGRGIWQVSCGEFTYAVNIDAMTCGCRKWDLTGLPCKHGIACIYKSKQHPEDFVSEYFKLPMYKLAYSHMIFPVPGSHDWTKTTSPDIDPPVFTKHPGRPKKNRIKGVNEPPGASGKARMTTITCSNCKLQGHRFPSCSKPLRADLQIRKNKHKSYRFFPGEASSSTPPSRVPPPPPPKAPTAKRTKTAAASSRPPAKRTKTVAAPPPPSAATP